MAALRRGLAGLAATVAAVALLGSGTAMAASLSMSSGALSYTSSPSEANHLTIWWEAPYNVYVLQDTGVGNIYVPSSVGKQGCHSYSAQIVYCDAGTLASVSVRTGDAGAFVQNKLTVTPVTLTAGAGDDMLIGGGGPDVLVAGGGNDTLTAGSGNTRLVGGTGTTTMTGGSGHNVYQGGSGVDTIRARNGVTEDVTCGAANDNVVADTADSASADCEAVDRGVAPVTPDDPATADGTVDDDHSPLGDIGPNIPAVATPKPIISTAPVALTQDNEVPVQVGCPATVAAGCQGSITLSLIAPGRADKVVAARRVKRRAVSRGRRFKIAAGEKAVVPVALSRRGGRTVRRHLRRRRTVRLHVTVTLRSEAGTHRTSRNITVHAARRAAGRRRRGGAR
jgi:hypothetical protein